MTDFLILAVAAFAAGVLNTIAGGGSFITFPALVFTGVPVIAANVTSAVAVFPGYLGGALGFSKELRNFDRKRLVKLALVTLAGGSVGSLLLLISSNDAFALVVPALLFCSTMLFLFADQIRDYAAKNSMAFTPYGALSLFFISVYGGYFNGGLGIIFLALFALWGIADLNLMNGLKSGLSFTLSAVSVAIFAIAGYVLWPEAVVMMVAATAGGYVGAPLARALPAGVVKGFIVAVGMTMSFIFLIRLF